jgi:hypothetical protein
MDPESFPVSCISKGSEAEKFGCGGGLVMTKQRNVMTYILCVGLILALASCAGTAKKASTGEYVDDSVITSRVKAALIADPLTKAREISVETFKGTVQLSGFVTTAAEKDKAGEIARNTKGVVEVKNNIIIK